MAACMAGVRRDTFTCVGWQVTLCDPIWQVTSRSSEMGFPWRAVSAFTFGAFYMSALEILLLTYLLTSWIDNKNNEYYKLCIVCTCRQQNHTACLYSHRLAVYVIVLIFAYFCTQVDKHCYVQVRWYAYGVGLLLNGIRCTFVFLEK